MNSPTYIQPLLLAVVVSCLPAAPPSVIPHRGFDVSSCVKCHSDLTEGKKYVHEPVRISCTICHDPQRAEFPHMLRAATNDLCLECHGAGARPGETVTLFNGRVKVPGTLLRGLRPLPVRSGHPEPYHPVFVPAGMGLPEINCLSCHLPHASDGSPQLLVTGAAGRKELCVKCHSH
jgi:predicted CXXCH cytochrome family protein